MTDYRVPPFTPYNPPAGKNPFLPPERERWPKCATHGGRFPPLARANGKLYKTCQACLLKSRTNAIAVGSQRRRAATAAEVERRRLAALTCCPAAEAQLLREALRWFDAHESPVFADYLSKIIAPSWLRPCCAGRINMLTRELCEEFACRRNNVLFRWLLTRRLATADFCANGELVPGLTDVPRAPRGLRVPGPRAQGETDPG